MQWQRKQVVVRTSLTWCERGIDEKGCSTLSQRCHCVLATSMECSLRPYHADVTTMLRPCHVEEDRTTLLIGSVGAYHFHASL